MAHSRRDTARPPAAPAVPVVRVTLPPGRPPLPAAHAPWRQRLLVAWWRGRFAVVAVCLALAAGLTVQTLRPAAAPTVPVVVAAHDLAAGATLTATDLAVLDLPAALAPAGAVPDLATLQDATSAVATPAGLPVVRSLLAGGLLTGPAGTVVTAVRLDDDGVAALLRPGDRVDLLANDGLGGDGVVVARRALVLTAAQQAEAELLATATGSPLVVAVAPGEAAALAGAMSGTSGLVAFVVP